MSAGERSWRKEETVFLGRGSREGQRGKYKKGISRLGHKKKTIRTIESNIKLNLSALIREERLVRSDEVFAVKRQY